MQVYVESLALIPFNLNKYNRTGIYASLDLTPHTNKPPQNVFLPHNIPDINPIINWQKFIVPVAC